MIRENGTMFLAKSDKYHYGIGVFEYSQALVCGVKTDQGLLIDSLFGMAAKCDGYCLKGFEEILLEIKV